MELEIKHYVKLFQKYWWLILLSTLVSLLLAMTRVYFDTPRYLTEVTFVISPIESIIDNRDVMDSLDTLDKVTISQTYAEILNSNLVRNSAIEALGLTIEDLSAYETETILLPESNVLRLTVTGTNPEIVAKLANEIGDFSITYTGRVYQVFKVSYLDQAYTPGSPYSPTPQRDALVAVVLGFAIGVMLILAIDQFGLFIRGNLPSTNEEESYISVSSKPIN
jgi:capsular polysaccharide biosynthesis protein